MKKTSLNRIFCTHCQYKVHSLQFKIIVIVLFERFLQNRWEITCLHFTALSQLIRNSPKTLIPKRCVRFQALGSAQLNCHFHQIAIKNKSCAITLADKLKEENNKMQTIKNGNNPPLTAVKAESRDFLQGSCFKEQSMPNRHFEY